MFLFIDTLHSNYGYDMQHLDKEILCYVMFFYVMLCFAMLCYDMLCYVICYVCYLCVVLCHDDLCFYNPNAVHFFIPCR